MRARAEAWTDHVMRWGVQGRLEGKAAVGSSAVLSGRGLSSQTAAELAETENRSRENTTESQTSNPQTQLEASATQRPTAQNAAFKLAITSGTIGQHSRNEK
jgi:hypothetical protein